MKLRTILAVLLMLLFVGVSFAQDETAEPTAESTLIAEVTAEPDGSTTINIQMPEQEAVVTQTFEFGRDFIIFISGAAAGTLTIGGLGLFFIDRLLRSPVLLNFIEYLALSRLDENAIKGLQTTGTLLTKAGQLISTVTDGKPNEPDTAATKPVLPTS